MLAGVAGPMGSVGFGAGFAACGAGGFLGAVGAGLPVTGAAFCVEVLAGFFAGTTGRGAGLAAGLGAGTARWDGGRVGFGRASAIPGDSQRKNESMQAHSGDKRGFTVFRLGTL